MGTRCLTRIHTEAGEKLLNLYRQFDGYPCGHGNDLFNFLDGFEIVNGYSGDEGEKAANGAGCLAAQMVAHFKMREHEPAKRRDKAIGGFYIYPVEQKDFGQDYEYIVTIKEIAWGSDQKNGSISNIKVISYGDVEFDGTLEEFHAYCNKTEDEE
jgi:hypothetical protein